MAHYKGRQSAEAVERDFAHFVDIAVPPGGLGQRLNAMYDFRARHGVQPKRGQWRRADDGGSLIRWCFSDQTLAAAFASEFNGK
jgi:hypothetical protein